ncbi:hypothetical protein [Nocardia sp. NPDC023988]|uniref:hypothetical protein n=1 Tax=unclassified Nocardia TaxID=2637762 RepID=UPI0034095291
MMPIRSTSPMPCASARARAMADSMSRLPWRSSSHKPSPIPVSTSRLAGLAALIAGCALVVQLA